VRVSRVSACSAASRLQIGLRLPAAHCLKISCRIIFQILPSPARGPPQSISMLASSSGSRGISSPRATSSAMYRSRTSSRVFPDTAARVALNVSFRASERSRNSDLYVSRYSSPVGSASPGSPCDVRASSAPGQLQRSCQTVPGTSPFRRDSGHARWQEQRHRTMVDSRRRPGLGGIAKLTWPHAWCALPAHARDLPGAAASGPALDTRSSCIFGRTRSASRASAVRSIRLLDRGHLRRQGRRPARRATHYEGVPVRCSRVQSLHELHVRRLLLVAVVGC
jgi:hypothetical protein